MGASLADVAVNPSDPWAWASLLGDAIDVVIPCFGGTGEAIRGFKAVADAIRAAESADALMELTQNTIDTIKDISRSFSEGNTCVYVAYANNTLEYVGITNDFGRRQKEWEGTRDIHKITGYIDRTHARCIEQTVIAVFGKGENGVLSNIQNSIGSKNRQKYELFEKFFKSLF